MRFFRPLNVVVIFVSLIASVSCNRRNAESDNDSLKIDFNDTISSVMPDTLNALPKDTMPKETFHIDGSDEALDIIKSLPEADLYLSGVMPSIAKYAPQYLERLLNSDFSKFIVVDKARMKVILYDKYGKVLKIYGMACSKKFGTKHKKADNRTPEGFFSVEGIYNSTDWLFTDDNGKTSDKKGQFGPRFIRLSIPGTTQIGIHGTCAPWSIGSRSSHGCIRITNEHIMELVDLVEIGMPVIIIPGKKDRAVNKEENCEIAYFPTDPKYAIRKNEICETENVKKSCNESQKDSMNSMKFENLNDSNYNKESEQNVELQND